MSTHPSSGAPSAHPHQGGGLSPDRKNEIIVQGQAYQILRKIGEGAFSAVYLCRRIRDSFHVAIKKATIQENEITKAHEEMQLMDIIGDHPNIVKVLGSEVSSVLGQPSFTFAMEYCGTTVIEEMMKAQKASNPAEKTFQSEKCMYIFSSVVSAIQHLHSLCPPVTHRDIKPENILLTDDGRYVMCDFGSATTMAYHCRDRKDAANVENDVEKNTTLLYRAPEMLEPWKKKRIDQKTDVWALGILLYYIMYFKFPFEETALGIINGTLSFPERPKHPESMKELVRLCLTKNPTERPTIFGLAQLMKATPEFGISDEFIPYVEDPGYEQATPYGADDPGPQATTLATISTTATSDTRTVMAATEGNNNTNSTNLFSAQISNSSSGGGNQRTVGGSGVGDNSGGSKANQSDLFGMLNWSSSSGGGGTGTVGTQPSPTAPQHVSVKEHSDLFVVNAPTNSTSAAQLGGGGASSSTQAPNFDDLFASAGAGNNGLGGVGVPPRSTNLPNPSHNSGTGGGGPPPDLFGPAGGFSQQQHAPPTASGSGGTAGVDLFGGGAWGSSSGAPSVVPATTTAPPPSSGNRQTSDLLNFGSNDNTSAGGSVASGQRATAGGPSGGGGIDDIMSGFSQSRMKGAGGAYS